MILNLLQIILTFAMAQQVGLEKGNSFQSIAISGQVTVTCNGFSGYGQNTYNCRDVTLEPSTYDYIAGPRDQSIDEIKLISKQESGSVVKKNEDFDGRSGRTENAVNLWISTLFQKPLLRDGRNIISYELLAKGVSKQSGEFAVQVTRGKPRVCPNATYNSIDFNDCQAQYSICQRYFKENNFCIDSNSQARNEYFKTLH